MPNSETSKCRDRLKIFCYGMGVDIGYGGDPITSRAITLDLPAPYTILGASPQHLSGDGRWLNWFKDGVLDFVYSSHLLEDFTAQEIPLILKEWLRVLKSGGHLVLYLPDQQRYLAYCQKNNQPINQGHRTPHFSLQFLLKIIAEHLGTVCTIQKASDLQGDYSFDLVLLKN